MPKRRASAVGRGLRSRRLAVGVGAWAVFLLLWQLAGSSSAGLRDLISTPAQVAASGADLIASGLLARHAALTLLELFVGFAPAVALGLGVGVAMSRVRRLHLLLWPLVATLHVLPQIALLPMLMLALGVGPAGKVVLAFLSGLFPVIINTEAGVRTMDPAWARSLRSLGASELDVVRKVVLPAALPAAVAGIRLGFGRALGGVIAAEMYVSTRGVGRLVQDEASVGRIPALFALGAFTAGFALVCVSLLERLEGRAGLWRHGSAR
jgi:NitT/TauT family transport system permease protein